MTGKKGLSDFRTRLSQDASLRGKFQNDLADLLKRHGVEDADLNVAGLSDNAGGGELIYSETGTTKSKTFIV